MVSRREAGNQSLNPGQGSARIKCAVPPPRGRPGSLTPHEASLSCQRTECSCLLGSNVLHACHSPMQVIFCFRKVTKWVAAREKTSQRVAGFEKHHLPSRTFPSLHRFHRRLPGNPSMWQSARDALSQQISAGTECFLRPTSQHTH